MQDYASTASFERGIAAFDPSKLNEQIAEEFGSALARQVKEEIASGKSSLRERFEELRSIFCRSNSIATEDNTKSRTRWIGELRQLLARVCLATLEPDLIILDEFQAL